MSVLVVTNKGDITSDVVINKLSLLGVEVFRLNTEDVCSSVSTSLQIGSSLFKGEFRTQSRVLDFSKISSVYYRRPLPPEPECEDPGVKEFMVTETSTYLNWLWHAIDDVYWMSSLKSIRKADSKISQLRIAPLLGFEIPDTIITNNPNDVKTFYQKHSGKIVNKVLAKGFVDINGETRTIYTNLMNSKMLDFLEACRVVPCVFQEYIPKEIEIRVTVVGKQVFAAEIHSQTSQRTKHDWRRYDLENTLHRPHELPEEVQKSCVKITKHYGLEFGAIDLVLTPEGKYIFLEINPNGQWAWIEVLTGLPISDAIAELLANPPC
jgi:glutathione synthase/RimK-type ligase-like ATP-grasp enzyme